jgi:hypothetical protein
MSQHLEQVLEEAKKKNLSILSVLRRLADLELEYRWQALVNLRFTQSRLPDRLTIDQFDFDHHKSRKEKKERILSLMDLEFIRERMDVILIGNPGTGKTFIAQSVGFLPGTLFLGDFGRPVGNEKAIFETSDIHISLLYFESLVPAHLYRDEIDDCTSREAHSCNRYHELRPGKWSHTSLAMGI